ncbi:unnamed protein product [Mytilus coruscus]|uniref:Integrase core domain-containing protein n=1 Tax=Mytilus coruscus TaxID=42192 RepID=A0A6J8DAU4_MYTCO|nr:unnamed protein product [Mytilus coruscus]
MADGRVMQEILINHGLKHLLHRFKLEKISPEILCQLSSHEMEELGVQNRSDMMNLRIILKIKGIHVPRWRLRDSIERIDENGPQERRRGRLHRRIYNVEEPNYLWHIDTYHKLIRWKFIIVGGIDGYSRLLMFMKCCDNNKLETVNECFRTGISRYGTPNVPIERVAFDGTALHIHAGKSKFWVDAWSCHRLLTTRSSPLVLWVAGQLQNPVGAIPECNLQYYGVEGFDNSSLEQDGNSRPVFCPISETLWQRYRDSRRASVTFSKHHQEPWN